RRRIAGAMRVIRPAEEPGRDVPALAVIGDDRDGLPIVTSQHANDAAVPVRLKGDAIADLELKHLGMCSHLSQELETGNDSVVQVDQFCLGQLCESILFPTSRSIMPPSLGCVPVKL